MLSGEPLTFLDICSHVDGNNATGILVGLWDVVDMARTRWHLKCVVIANQFKIRYPVSFWLVRIRRLNIPCCVETATPTTGGSKHIIRDGQRARR